MFDSQRYSRHVARYGRVQKFVKESNRIEGLSGASTAEIGAHLRLIAVNRMTTKALEEFVGTVEPTASLRRRSGQNVVITRRECIVHRGLEGGPAVARALTNLLRAINSESLTPCEAHVEFETLHPFTDGNGRAGRALWLWQVMRQEPLRDPFALSFLHSFYYDSLEAMRSAAKLATPTKET